MSQLQSYHDKKTLTPTDLGIRNGVWESIANNSYKTGKTILKLLQDTSRRDGMTVVIITHNSALTAMADRIIRVKSGTVISENKNENVIPVENLEW